MKRILIVIILAANLLTACTNNEIEYNTIEKISKEAESNYTPMPINKASIDDIILNHLDGEWVNYYNSNESIVFVIKSLDEIYINHYGTISETIEDIKNNKLNKSIISINENGFIVDLGDGFSNLYTFDLSNVTSNNFSDIILYEEGVHNNKNVKTVSYVRPGKEYIQLEPAIGMTYEEVKASTWGEPYDINKTTYSWGTTEQWCYSGYRYIYFENGIVTAIQE